MDAMLIDILNPIGMQKEGDQLTFLLCQMKQATTQNNKSNRV